MKFLKKMRLPEIAKKHPVAFWVAVVMHLILVIGLAISSAQHWDDPKKPKVVVKPIPKAVIVDVSEIKRERQRLVDGQKQKALRIQREERQLKKLEDARYQKQREINRLKSNTQKHKKAKAAAQRDRKKEEKRLKKEQKNRKTAEQKAKAAEKNRRQAEQKTKAAEKNRKAAEQKTKTAEKNRKKVEQKVKDAEKNRKKAEQKAKTAEKKAKIAEKNRKKAEQKTKAAEKLRKKEEQKARAAEKTKQRIQQRIKDEARKFKAEQNKRALTHDVQAEEDQDREIAQEDILSELRANYINQIASRVKSQWRYNGAKDNWSCKVRIVQDVDGNVKSVYLKSCNISVKSKEKSFKNAIKRAVNKASPLPPAPDKSVFDREILFNFKVN